MKFLSQLKWFNISLALISSVQTYLLTDVSNIFLKTLSIPLLILPYYLGLAFGEIAKRMSINPFKTRNEFIYKWMKYGSMAMFYFFGIYMVLFLTYIISKGHTIAFLSEDMKGMFIVPHTTIMMLGIIKAISDRKIFIKGSK